jgi:hypothetical protein
MKTKIKATIVIPSKKEADELRRIIKDIENDKTPFRDLKLKKVKKKK